MDHDETLPTAAACWPGLAVPPASLRCPDLPSAVNGYVFLATAVGKGLGELADDATCLTAEGRANPDSGLNVAVYLEDLTTTRHQGGMTAGYLDGHVALMTPNEASLLLPERRFAGSLLCFVAQSLKDVHTTVSAQYTALHPAVAFGSSYGGSGALLSSIKASGKGDLFLPADESYLAAAGALVRVAVPVADQHPVLAVRTGNPLGIDRSWRHDARNPE